MFEKLNQLVSIIIPCYNRKYLISETLNSILDQTYQNWECIIVDDGSTDDTKSVVKKYVDKDSRFKLYDRPEYHKPGGNGARNFGFKLSKGNFIVFLDSDDLFHEKYLEYQVEKMLNESSKNYVVCENQIFIGDRNNIVGKWFNANIISENILEDYINKKLGIQTASVMFKKYFLERIKEKSGLFNEDLLQSQEWELFSRIIFYDSNYAINNRELLFIRKTNESITTSLYQNDSRLIRSQLMALSLVCDFLNKEQRLTLKLKKYFINSSVTLLKKDSCIRNEAKNLILSILNKNFNDLIFYYRFLIGCILWRLFRRGHSLLIYK